MQPGGIPTISPRDAAAAVAGDGSPAADPATRPLIVDVREPEEFASQRIQESVLIPMSQFVARHEELPRNRPLVMQCQSGSRSASATMYLVQRGWTDVRNLDGGIAAWTRDGLPVRTGPPEPGEGDL
jgi:rhodanese-related sulfurtransferase